MQKIKNIFSKSSSYIILGSLFGIALALVAIQVFSKSEGTVEKKDSQKNILSKVEPIVFKKNCSLNFKAFLEQKINQIEKDLNKITARNKNFREVEKAFSSWRSDLTAGYDKQKKCLSDQQESLVVQYYSLLDIETQKKDFNNCKAQEDKISFDNSHALSQVPLVLRMKNIIKSVCVKLSQKE